MRMRVADYITHSLYDEGGETVFLVTGGMIMHLTDALYQHGKQEYVCCHHEQAAAMAAEAYGRMTGKLGVAYVTAGPGALNTITGITGAYVDSSPMIVVGGNSKVALAQVKGPRQFALQGFDSLDIFRQITKYAVRLEDLSQVRYEVEKCIYLAKNGRVGPVYLEVPVDLQGAAFDPDDFPGFTEPIAKVPEITDAELDQVLAALKRSKRPCLLAGAGVRHGDAVEALHAFAEATGIPVLTSRLGMDLMDHDHPLFVGRPGTYGDRPANFTVQNCDLLLTVGCRLGIGLVGYDFADFAKNAFKIHVDIDARELNKPSVIPDIPVQGEARNFFIRLTALWDGEASYTGWVRQTQYWKQRYPVDLPEYDDDSSGINSYRFMTRFSELAPEDALFVVDTGSCFHVHAQAFKVKAGQRHIITGGLSTMGYTPGAIGASVAAGRREVFCITGDGSFQMNLQELQTIRHHRLPVKFILINNGGYLLIRHTQSNFMGGRYLGEGPDSGVSFVPFERLAETFDLGYLRISQLDHLDDQLNELFRHPGPMICEIMTPTDQLLIPRVSSRQLEDGTMISTAYDDMFPFLPRDEYQSNCLE
ncbi:MULTISPECIES: thiamine pyrophosphate-binding protein [unclassified Paenibacillus]|uniref:thiamine pyrophosphate-binding protein n=1 Tax=unclassified Paenibacillus TaxID=185978 RepID=UPI0030F64FE6